LAGKTHLKDYRENLFHKQGGMCAYCHRKMFLVVTEGNPRRATLDHRRPISRGGQLSDIYNLCLACFRCNQVKSDMTEREFRRQVRLCGSVEAMEAAWKWAVALTQEAKRVRRAARRHFGSVRVVLNASSSDVGTQTNG